MAFSGLYHPQSIPPVYCFCTPFYWCISRLFHWGFPWLPCPFSLHGTHLEYPQLFFPTHKSAVASSVETSMITPYSPGIDSFLHCLISVTYISFYRCYIISSSSSFFFFFFLSVSLLVPQEQNLGWTDGRISVILAQELNKSWIYFCSIICTSPIP